MTDSAGRSSPLSRFAAVRCIMSFMGGGAARGAQEALVVLLVVLIGGGAAIQLVNRWAHLGSEIGSILFAALPLVAVFAASSRLGAGSDDW